MNTKETLYSYGNPRGWTDAEKLSLCMQFIDSMNVSEKFDAFVRDAALDEDEWEEAEYYREMEMHGDGSYDPLYDTIDLIGLYDDDYGYGYDDGYGCRDED